MTFKEMIVKKGADRFEIRLAVNKEYEWEFRYPILSGLYRQIQSQSIDIIHNSNARAINCRLLRRVKGR
jgi:hypothetical protein